MYRLLLIVILTLPHLSTFANHKVFVIHGYGSSKLMMRKIDRSIRHENFKTENYRYKSISEDLDTIGKQLYNKIKSSGLDSVSFVTHSMGALVVRSMVKYAILDNDFPLIYRIVMIAPPNKGAEIADFYSSFSILRKLIGPNVERMKTDSGSYAQKLPMPHQAEIGIIAGVQGKGKGYNFLIEGDDDGLLTPEKTKLGIEKDFVIIKGEHNVLTHKKNVCKLIIEFSQYGFFKSKNASKLLKNNSKDR